LLGLVVVKPIEPESAPDDMMKSHGHAHASPWHRKAKDAMMHSRRPRFITIVIVGAPELLSSRLI